MPYLGNDLQVAQPSYRNIDDISGSFNSSTTSFPLLVSGSAPVPFPINSNQCLISVAGVVQRPDDSGTEGFRISGGNIIFSSAPSTGADFFGVILAGADYVNVGANFPSGSAAVPSITFDSDLDTGIYNSAANQVSVTTAGTERLRIDSAGQIESVSLGSASAPAFSFTTDPNTGIYSPGADQVAISTNGSGRLFVDSSGRVGIGTVSPGTRFDVISTASASTAIARFKSGTAAGDRGVEIASDSNSNVFIQSIKASDNTSGYQLCINPSGGNVGIGTTSVQSLLNIRKDANSTNPGDSASIVLSNRSTAINGNIAGGIFADCYRDVSDPSYTGGIWFTRNSALGNLSSSSDIVFGTQQNGGTGLPSERARIDSSGRLLVGTSTARANFFNGSAIAPFLQIEGTGSARMLSVFSNNTDGGVLVLGRQGGSTPGGNTLVANNDEIGIISFQASDGTDPTECARIQALIDGAPGNNDTPGRLVFSTTADGASSPTERMRISNNGYVGISTTGAQLDILSGAGTGSWGQGIRIGHDATYWAGIRCNGDSNFDRQFLDFWTSRATSAGLIARLTDRFYCNVTTITSLTSERRYKQNIDVQPLIPANCWTVARDLPVRTYEYKDNPGNLTYGPIVDEIEPIDPSLILNTGREDDEGPVRTYDNGRLQAMYQVALQEALKRIEQLEAKVAALEAA